MKTTKEPKQKDTRSATHRASTIFAMIAIPVELIIAIIIFKYVMGDPSNFIDNNPANNPLTGNYMGTIYKGGFIVPILMTLLMMVVTFTIERWWTLKQARGTQNPFQFVKTVKEHISSVNLEAARKQCDIQKGSIANIIRAGIDKYEEMDKVQGLTAEKKTLAVQKEIEDAEGMEMPMLERNLPILSTCASIGVLLGLLGTVLGMIRAFAGLAHAGSPDAAALATGISEALINTAFGIGTSMLAIVFYNYFTTRIDRIIYTAAEASQTIVRTFSITHPDKQN
jgi:biopolymer transport protein ExbB